MLNKPSTKEEILNLPIGPEFGSITIIYSEEDKKNGYIIFNNEKIEINTKVSKMNIPTLRETALYFSEDDDIMFVIDDEGQGWRLGKYKDGGWFRQRMN